MKLLGAGLVLLGAALFLAGRRREERDGLLLMEAISEDLALFSYEITALALPIPRLMENRRESRAGRALWQPVLRYLAEKTLEESWLLAVSKLPGGLPGCLAHLGGVLSVGGETAGRAIAETREALADIIAAQRTVQRERGPVRTSLVLSGAALLILVLI